MGSTRLTRGSLRGPARWLLLGLFLGACNRATEGAQCAFNDDCTNPLICASSRCRVQCRTDRDCPAGTRCHNAGVPDKAACLPLSSPALCVDATHCREDALCGAGNVCRLRCTLNPTCEAAARGSLCMGGACSVAMTVAERYAPVVDAGDPTDAATPDVMTLDVVTPDVVTPDAGPGDVSMPNDQTDDAPDAVDVPDVILPAHCATTPDRDGDTHNDRACGGDDCDDGERLVHPGAAEQCNDRDDNCDGARDEGLTERCYDGPTGTVDVGVCRAGTRTCAAGAWGACAMQTLPSEDVCDGRDNNCNGMTDEGAELSCVLPNAFAACRNGACAVDRCTANYGDCDATAPGCETDLRSAVAHCGACNARCRGGPGATAFSCVNRVCAIQGCAEGSADCDGMLANGCEVDTASDATRCGSCTNVCATTANATPVCEMSRCGARCAAGFGDCDGDGRNGCEATLANDPSHCGACGRACPAPSTCVSGSCVQVPFPSNGSEGAFDPAPVLNDAGAPQTTTVTLSAGVHQFTTIRVRPQIRVVTSGTGVLDLRATGAVLVEGVIDLSGGVGGRYGNGDDDAAGVAGGGGSTGTTLAGASGVVGACGAPGGGGQGSPGATAPGSSTMNCGGGGRLGGGVGGETGRPGGGGGGFAGGGGGSGHWGAGGNGAGLSGAGVGGTGGRAAAGARGGGGGQSGLLGYAGGEGGEVPANLSCGAGGGGSIGLAAASDLAMRTTFQTGSGGGGGGGAYSTCSGSCRQYQGNGGGGGGGALRISSAVSISVTGSLRVDGGAGGSSVAAFGGCGGGGGSGGALYLSAPRVETSSLATVSALGGAGGTSNTATVRGGSGGPGRIRVAVVQGRCSLLGTWSPALVSGCSFTPGDGTPGRVYLGPFPEP